MLGGSLGCSPLLDLQLRVRGFELPVVWGDGSQLFQSSMFLMVYQTYSQQGAAHVWFSLLLFDYSDLSYKDRPDKSCKTP